MSYPMVQMPFRLQELRLETVGLDLIVAMSAGKDSTATALAMKEAGLTFRMVFADTGWEDKRVYAHLDHLREKIGPIDVVGAPGGMVAKVKERAGFPGRLQRWCTSELKLKPLREYHDAYSMSFGVDTVNVVGVRAAESKARSKLPELEDDDTWNGWIWRPLLNWTTEQVLEIHHAHGVEVNPLYKLGHNRVGCYPCIMSTKEDIRLTAENSPERIDEIRELETWCTEERVRRNEEKPGRYKHAIATFFQHHPDRPEIYGIDAVVGWSKTARGGKTLPLLPQAPSGGCFKWGLCEAPSSEEEDAA
jgi:3'-phosphoadenosine 5'-phosphosulfate sulfotransferase (PAPS reductase)/FAD synthetase